jgi:hypothetical protein
MSIMVPLILAVLCGGLVIVLAGIVAAVVFFKKRQDKPS